MALTNFALLTEHQKTVWALDTWRMARNYSFIDKFAGTGPDFLIQRVTELTRTEKGTRAVITLVADLEGDGVVGDRTLEGNEEAMKSFDQMVKLDQIRHANRHEGRLADQKSVVDFRSNSRDVLAYWLADRLDQLAFLTLSGVSYTQRNNGAPRVGSDFPYLEFAADVTPPTDMRRVRWDNTAKQIVIGGTTSSVAVADTPAWELFVQLKALAKEQYIRPLRDKGGKEYYCAFLTPQAMAKLKVDPTFMQNLRNAEVRGSDNPLFTGDPIVIDGIILHEHRHVYNTSGAPAGQKWGSTGNVDGCQVLFCGAQALAMADIGPPTWVEKGFDYDNSQGISVSKIVGFLKPKFTSIYANNTVQDFGVISAFVAQ